MEININDLPKYSPWPYRLLCLENFEKKYKTASEILREYEDEKWGSLLTYIKSSNKTVSLKDVEKIVFGKQPELISIKNGKLLKMTGYEAFKVQYKIVLNTLKNFLPTKAICEFGAGYGQIILNLANEKEISQIPLLAGEFTSSGEQLIDYLANVKSKKISTFHCDLSKPNGTYEKKIPHKSIIFTCFSACYVQEYNIKLIQNFISINPAVVINFEPIYEHCNSATLIGAMQKRYIELNGYNRNLLSILKEAEHKKIIKIVFEKSQVFGSNPFLPFSIVAWKPV